MERAATQNRVPRARFAEVVHCVAATPAGTRRYLAMNLNEGGIFLLTLFPMDKGTPLTCNFTIPNSSRVITAKGEVAWVRAGSMRQSTPSGMGVRFTRMKVKDRQRIESFTKKLDPR